MAQMQTIKTGMDNRQMKKIAMKSHTMSGPKMPKLKTASTNDEIKSNYSEENRSVGLKKNAKMKAKKSTPMIKPSRKGLLHEKLGVPKGQKIPAEKLDQALNSKSPSERKEANFAKNISH